MSPQYTRIARLLDDQEPEARRLAAQQIPGVRGAEAGQLLLRALGDADWRVRKEASAVAASVEGRDDVVRALRSALDDKVNIGLRNAAVEALIALGADAVVPAVDALRALDADGRKLAVEVLGGIPDPRGTHALAAALGDPDLNVRCAAAEALGRASLGGDDARSIAIAALTDLLRCEEMFLKLAALDSLTRLEARLAWSVVEPFASDPLLKRYALAAAAGSREVAAVAALARATGDASQTIAREAVVAVAQVVLEDPDDRALVDVIHEVMRGLPRAHATIRSMAETAEDPHVRGSAIAALGLLRDPNDVPRLVDALGDHERAEYAEVALRVFGEEALEPLVEAGRTGSPEVRGATLSLVPMLSPEGEPAMLEMLREALRDPSHDVLAAATRVFAKTGAAEDLRHVARFVLHTDPRVSAAAWSATHALAQRHEAAARAMLMGIDASSPEAVIGCIVLGAVAGIGSSPDEDFQFLQSALSNGDARARRAAVDALAAIGHASAVEAVSFALADEEPDVVIAAVRALGRLGRGEGIVALLGSTRDPSLVAIALRALADADAGQALHVALPLVRSSDPAVACAAVEAIGALVGPAREDALFAALEHGDPDVVKLALNELGRAIDARTLTRLGMALDHEARDVRKLAAELLGNEASAAAHAVLRARLEREKDANVREALTAALAARPQEGPGSADGSRGEGRSGGR
jgi:HEAT repeat protein